MTRLDENAKWLTRLAPTRALPISAAYLTPFFLEYGLSLSQIFLLQSIFSLAYVLLEIPGGYLADKIGRALCIKLSVPISSAAMLAYGFSDQFWQFVLLEVALAVGCSLVSGVDMALLMDSLKAKGREEEFVMQSQRINAFGYAAIAFGVPVGVVMVHFFGIQSTLIADGLLELIGLLFACRLVEAPRISKSQEAQKLSTWQAMCELTRNREARWLVVLGSALSASTYLAFWLSAPYYESMSVPVVLFGAILALRNLWKAWLSHHYTQEAQQQRNMFVYVLLAGLVYVGMASGQIWLIWMVLGHDIVQALHSQPIAAQLNAHMSDEHRATLNSMVSLVQRLLYSVAGPLVGLLVDTAGLQTGLLVTGATCSSLALLALLRLRAHHTFT